MTVTARSAAPVGTWLVTFDVTSDRRRYALTRRLERFGTRVAYSVFAIRASDEQLGWLVQECDPLVGQTGHLLALPLCSSCDVAVFGHDREELPERGWTAW